MARCLPNNSQVVKFQLVLAKTQSTSICEPLMIWQWNWGRKAGMSCFRANRAARHLASVADSTELSFSFSGGGFLMPYFLWVHFKHVIRGWIRECHCLHQFTLACRAALFTACFVYTMPKFVFSRPNKFATIFSMIAAFKLNWLTGWSLIKAFPHVRWQGSGGGA